MDEELAELIGILLGDGSLGIYNSKVGNRVKTQYRIKVTLNAEKDLAYSSYVAKLFEKVFKQTPKIWKRKEKAIDVYLLGRQSLYYLLELGLVLAPKWERAIVPERFLKPPSDRWILRGYMDTDGCISVVNNNGIRYPRIEMKICPSPMQNQLIRFMQQNGLEPQINRLEKGKVRVVLAGMKKLRKWNDLIGFSNERNLKVAFSFLKSPSCSIKNGSPDNSNCSGITCQDYLG